MAQYIPDEYFKGVQSPKSECPLAFITPSGTDKAAESRIQTVKNWAGGWSGQNKDVHFETIKNVPLHNYKIAKEIRRWSTSNVVWRIEDPRGFQLEISSGNMAYLMSETIINKGTIQSELQWVRNGAQNFLLPTNSEEYKNYSQITATLKSTTTLKDVTIGDTILIGTGEEGMYLGGYHIVEQGNWDGDLIKSIRRYFMMDKDGEIIRKSALKNITIVKKGIESDNRDWGITINELEKRKYSLLYTVKKQDVKKIHKTLRFEDAETRDGEDFHNDFVKHNDKFYTVAHYMGGRGSVNVITLYPDENTLVYETTRTSGFGATLFGGHSVEEKYYKAVTNNCTAQRLKITIGNSDFILS